MAASAVLGVALMAVAARFEDAAPWVLVAPPLAALVVVAVFSMPVLAAVGVFATFPVGTIGIPAFALPLQVVEAAVIASAVVVALKRLAAGRAPLPWSPVLWWALVLVGWTLVILPSAVDEGLAVKQVLSLAGGLLFASVVLGACANLRDVRVMLAGFVAVSVLISALALLEGSRFQAAYGGALVGGRLQGAFDHPNQLGSLSAMGMILSVGLAVASRTRGARAAAVGATGIIAVGLALSLSRGAWIGAALGLIFVLSRLREARRALLMLLVPIFVAAPLVWSLGSFRLETEIVGERARSLTVLSPYDSRRAIYGEAVREIRERPITGQGPGGFPVASVRSAARHATVSAEHAHNLLLTWGAESGVPAVLLIFGLAVGLGVAASRAGRGALRLGGHRDRALVVAIAGGLVSVAGQGAFDYTLRNSIINLATWGLVGGLLACRRLTQFPAERAREPW